MSDYVSPAMDDARPLGNTEDTFGKRSLHVKIGNLSSEPIPVSIDMSSIEIGTVDQGYPNLDAYAWPVKITESMLPSGAATEAQQITQDAYLNSIDLVVNTTLDATLSSRASESTLSTFRTTNHSDLLQVEAYQVSGNESLTNIDSNIDIALFTLASESTLTVFETTNHADLLQVQAYQVTSNTVLSEIKTDTAHLDVALSTRATESTLSSLNAKVVVADTGNVTVVTSALPSGAATAIRQDTGNASLASIDSKLTSPVAVSQSGIWTTGRTWTLLNSTDSINAVQSGTWNINNVSGTVSLPTGAATSALQITGNASLSSIDGKLNSLGQKNQAGSVPVVIASDQTAIPATQSGTWTVQQGSTPTAVANAWAVKLTDGTNTTAVKAASTAALATDTSTVVALSPNSPLPTGSNNVGSITNVTGVISLPTGASTSVLQTTGNTSLASIDGKLSDNFGVATSALRTAAQLGNASGAADFNSGVTSTQTIRTASNLYTNDAYALTSESYSTKRALDVLEPRIGFSSVSDVQVTATTANTAVTIFNSNANRKWAFIQNVSGANGYLGLGFTPTSTTGLLIVNNASFEIDLTNLFTGSISIVFTSNNRTIEAFEGT